MSHAAAEAIVKVVIRQMDELGALLHEIKPLCAFDDYVENRIGIGQCLGAMVDVLNPIVRQYPDLQPPEHRPSTD